MNIKTGSATTPGANSFSETPNLSQYDFRLKGCGCKTLTAGHSYMEAEDELWEST